MADRLWNLHWLRWHSVSDLQKILAVYHWAFLAHSVSEQLTNGYCDGYLYIACFVYHIRGCVVPIWDTYRVDQDTRALGQMINDVEAGDTRKTPFEMFLRTEEGFEAFK